VLRISEPFDNPEWIFEDPVDGAGVQAPIRLIAAAKGIRGGGGGIFISPRRDRTNYPCFWSAGR
jgi:hypothetical protein